MKNGAVRHFDFDRFIKTCLSASVTSFDTAVDSLLAWTNYTKLGFRKSVCEVSLFFGSHCRLFIQQDPIVLDQIECFELRGDRLGLLT
jgi:hypothetical protein